MCERCAGKSLQCCFSSPLGPSFLPSCSFLAHLSDSRRCSSQLLEASSCRYWKMLQLHQARRKPVCCSLFKYILQLCCLGLITFPGRHFPSSRLNFKTGPMVQLHPTDQESFFPLTHAVFAGSSCTIMHCIDQT